MELKITDEAHTAQRYLLILYFSIYINITTPHLACQVSDK